MAWTVCIESSSPPLFLEVTTPDGLHAYSNSENDALRVLRKSDAMKLNDIVQENVVDHDLGGVDNEAWVLLRDGTTDGYLNLSNGFFEDTNNPSGALQFPSAAEANKINALLEDNYTATLLE